MTTNPERYNIRVYGLCLDAFGRVLVTDERRGGMSMTKFPGGGNEFGEGLADTLRRELREEIQSEIEILGLFYANDFLQISAFNPKDQLISIYYLVSLIGEVNFPVTEKINDFGNQSGDVQTFRWMALQDLDGSHFTFPIDKIVVRKLLDNIAYLQQLMH